MSLVDHRMCSINIIQSAQELTAEIAQFSCHFVSWTWRTLKVMVLMDLANPNRRKCDGKCAGRLDTPQISLSCHDRRTRRRRPLQSEFRVAARLASDKVSRQRKRSTTNSLEVQHSNFEFSLRPQLRSSSSAVASAWASQSHDSS